MPIAGYFYDELVDWDRTLDLYEDEMAELDTKLTVLIQQNTIPHLADNAEHFLNLFQSQRSAFNTLAEEIYNQENRLKKDDEPLNDSVVTGEVTTEQQNLREKMKTAGQHFIETKYSCYNFLSGLHKK